MAAKQVLEFDDLSRFLQVRNGNFLYRVPFRDGWAFLKVYRGSRGPLETLAKSFSNVVSEGQTSYRPRTRLRVERECIALWRRHGFRTFGVHDDVEVVAPGCPPGLYLLLEYVEAPKLIEHMRDAAHSADVRFATWRRFLLEWGRRHERAIAEREPRLVHENGDAKHVMILEDGSFLWFDFEMVYRSSSRVADHVSREIVQYLWHLHKSLPRELRSRLFEETVAGYPQRERLLAAYDHFFRHPNPLYRLGRAADRRFSQRARKSTSKYRVARRLRELAERA